MVQSAEIKRVLLIDPRGFGSGLNLGLGYIAAVLIEKGYEVKVVDCNNFPVRLSKGASMNLGSLTHEDWRIKVGKGLDWQPQAIGVSINSFTQDNAYEVTRFCRSKMGDNAIYIAGGPHVSVFKKEFMEKNRNLFDFGIIGEGEETIIDLLSNYDNPASVKGIVYYDLVGGKAVQTEERPVITNLDTLPFPNLEVFDTVSVAERLYNYQLSSSRGCPYKCVFCSQILSRKWRARTPEHVIAEIKLALEKYKIQSITFWDDNFTLDINRAKRICDLMMKENLNLEYSLAGVRADRLDDELLRKLKESGCTSVSIGIEEGDEEVFKYVGKGESLEDIRKAVHMLQKHEIPISSYMITGLINSNYESFLRSLKYVESLKISAHWNIAFPLPLTPLYDWVQKNGRFLMTIDEGFKHCMTSKNPPVVFDTPDYPKEQRLKAYYVGNLRCLGYDMVISSRNASLFRQVFDIFEAVLRYDLGNFWWHFSYLFDLFAKSLFNSGRVVTYNSND